MNKGTCSVGNICVTKSINLPPFWVPFYDVSVRGEGSMALIDVSKNDEFCIQNEELCIKTEEFCIKNEELCI